MEKNETKKLERSNSDFVTGGRTEEIIWKL